MRLKNTRTKKSAINTSCAVLSKVIFIIVNFICRTIFIKILGNEYVGINGLFTNIIAVISFVDLGIESIILYELYKPVAEDNKEKIKTLMHFYKRCYYIIATAVMTIGIAIIPFLNKIVYNYTTIQDNIIVIYLIFLAQAVLYYVLIYKRLLIKANQKEYIISIIEIIVTLFQNILEILFLIITRSFIIYLIIQMGTTVLMDFIISAISSKMYPYVSNEKYNKISENEKKNTVKDIRAFMWYRFGYIITESTDNIIISIFLGLSQVGQLLNYQIITNSISKILQVSFGALTGSIGNLNTIKESSKKENVFYQILLISFFVYGYISISTMLLIDKFITIWLGAGYVLSFSISIALGLNLYIEGMRYVSTAYRNTLGLFKKGRFLPLISAILNIVLSVVWVKSLGAFGVLISTALTSLFILNWYDPYLIHKVEFKTSVKRYYVMYLYYIFITIVTFLVCYKVISFLKLPGILGFIVSGILITCICMIIFGVSTFKLNEFKGIRERIKSIFS